MVDKLIAHRMLWLLVALILTLVVSPIIDMHGQSLHRLYLVLLTTVLMISAVYAASVSRVGRIALPWALALSSGLTNSSRAMSSAITTAMTSKASASSSS